MRFTLELFEPIAPFDILGKGFLLDKGSGKDLWKPYSMSGRFHMKRTCPGQLRILK